ncbi:MAG: molecular chaperone DnaJ [Coriobacteriia bacterium]|nr:molecular chaperone DnaJ [Coriobacteriia bacterium]
MAPSSNYYDVLGVRKDASSDDIKKAFRRLARKHHPDTGGDEEKFKEINQAYEVLADGEKRKQYDQYGQYFSGQVPPGAGRPQGGRVRVDNVDLGDLGDLFGSVFGGAAGRTRGPQPKRGHDIQMELGLTFEQAYEGSSVRVEVERTEPCDACAGSGAKPGTSPVSCAPCGGRGAVSDGQGMFAFSRTCPTCGGSGTVIEEKCSKCRGAGRVRRRRPLTVNVPAGATDGGRLRFKGKGEPGEGGGPAGDLYVVTRISPHPYFSRDGADVVLELPISVAEAALGAEVRIPTPDGGRAKLKIPFGTQHGRVFKMSGKGAPRLKGTGQGDLLVKAKVVVPLSLSERQKDLLGEFVAEGHEDIRAHIG